jgi:uncharacterized iron-regulated membrane protein
MNPTERPAPVQKHRDDELDRASRSAVVGLALMLALVGTGLGLFAWVGFYLMQSKPAQQTTPTTLPNTVDVDPDTPRDPNAPLPVRRPGSREEAVRIDQLIEQLGDASFATRQQAQRELIDLGERARPALEVAARSGDAEVAHAAMRLLRLLEQRR